MQDCADEWHDKETFDSVKNELKEIDIEEMPELHAKKMEELEEARESWLDGVKLRRTKMDVLAINSPNYDYHARCKVKHRATSYVTAVETYQANPNEMTEKIMDWSGARFWKALCQFMGVDEITDCGRCLSDQLNLAHSYEWAEENGYHMSVGEAPQS